MNIIELINSLKTPKNISVEQTTDLEIILKEFPYFQAAHFLHLNGLKNQNSFKYNNSLKKTAAYTTDRSVLFNFISSNDYNFNANHIAPQYHETKKLEATENLSEKNSNPEENKTTTLPIGKPLQFNFSESHSFNEWLQVSSITPIQRDKEQQITSENKNQTPSKKPKSNFELIDEFIASNPKIKPTKTFENSSNNFDGTIENESLMTETLAHVYLEQEKYQKAIMAFTVLSLKYPEKSSFFANQIEAVKKLQEK